MKLTTVLRMNLCTQVEIHIYLNETWIELRVLRNGGQLHLFVQIIYYQTKRKRDKCFFFLSKYKKKKDNIAQKRFYSLPLFSGGVFALCLTPNAYAKGVDKTFDVATKGVKKGFNTLKLINGSQDRVL